MCVCVHLCGFCVRMFVEACSKSINVRKFTKSIHEPILECQIGFPGLVHASSPSIGNAVTVNPTIWISP